MGLTRLSARIDLFSKGYDDQCRYLYGGYLETLQASMHDVARAPIDSMCLAAKGKGK